MTKILLVISKYLPEYTGAAYRIDSLYRRLQENDNNIELEVLCNSTSEMHSKSYNHKGFKVRRTVFPWHLSWLPARLKNAIKTYYEAIFSFVFLIKNKPAFLHIIGSSGATIAALLYGRLYKIPRLIELVTCRATPRQYLPLLHYPNFLRLNQQSAIIAISQKLADDCREIGLVNNIWCRPNPINEQKFNIEDKNGLRTQLSPFDKDDIVIAMVAKFMPQKNQIFLIDMLKHLPENYKLLLAGPRAESGIFKERDGQYFEDIKDLIKQHNLEKRIHICTGFIDASDYMKTADIYVMPQHSEGLGTPMLEAMACGLPVVANEDEPAFVEWIKNGENGYLCVMKPEIWAKTIIKALEISTEKLDKSSKYIHEVASTGQCDAHYVKLINALIKMPVTEELNIKDVF